MQHYSIPSESQMLELAQAFAHACLEEQGAWIYLSGELGAGKTTWVRGFLHGLGYQDRVKSPSYALVESYEFIRNTKTIPLFHFDFYRIQDERELITMGLEEYFHDQAICLVEWPEHAQHLLPRSDISITITPQEMGRDVAVISNTPRGAKILERLSYA